MASFTALIADDEPHVRNRISDLLEHDQEVSVVGQAGNRNETLGLIAELTPNILFLDIKMPEIGGFQLLDILEPGQVDAVVFITHHQDLSLETYSYGVVDYLTRPFDRIRFESSLNRIKKRLSNIEKNRLVPEPPLAIRADGRMLTLDQRDIDFIESDGNYVNVHSDAEAHRVRATMQEMHAQLDPKIFLRIHRSYIVNRHNIRGLEHLYRGDYSIVVGSSHRRITSSNSYRENMEEILKGFKEG